MTARAIASVEVSPTAWASSIAVSASAAPRCRLPSIIACHAEPQPQGRQEQRIVAGVGQGGREHLVHVGQRLPGQVDERDADPHPLRRRRVGGEHGLAPPG